MKGHGRKLIAPIVISALLILYEIGFAVVCIRIEALPLPLKLLGGLIPLLLVGVCIFVLVERIKEIRSGEEDDLSQY